MTSMTAWYIVRVKNKLTKGLYYAFVFSMIVPFQMVMFTMTYIVTSLNFGEVMETVLRPEVFDKDGNLTDGLTYLERQTTIEFDGTYAQFKKFLSSILNQPEKMALVGVNAAYKDSNGRLEGLFILEQYAFAGYNRDYDDIPIPALEHGNLDKGGIFGNFIEDEEIRKDVFPEEENEQEEE